MKDLFSLERRKTVVFREDGEEFAVELKQYSVADVIALQRLDEEGADQSDRAAEAVRLAIVGQPSADTVRGLPPDVFSWLANEVADFSGAAIAAFSGGGDGEDEEDAGNG